MVRQCAWCLHLINNVGERLSLQPVPKSYDATHGMCRICGAVWLGKAVNAEQLQALFAQCEEKVRNSPLSY
jgi:hypothetical protein